MNTDNAPLVHHAGLGQAIRSGSWADHCHSTYDLCHEAIREARWDAAAELARYTVQEAQEPVELYLAWIPQIRQFLDERGVPAPVLASDEARLVKSLCPGETDRFDPQAGWQRVRNLVEQAVSHCDSADGDAASAALEASRETWLDTHDRLCDWVQGMIAIVAERTGEAQVGALWDRLMGPMFDAYDRYDVDKRPWHESAELLLQVTAEALRGHLSGPERRGTLEFVEEPERVGFRFRPCGSGGRNFTGETFNDYPLTTERHDWAWNLEGVCLYCAHCCALSERNPIERYGYPARVVEPPYANSQGRREHCTWWVYKHPRQIPEDVYRRTGHHKPARIGGAATRAAQPQRGPDAEVDPDRSNQERPANGGHDT